MFTSAKWYNIRVNAILQVKWRRTVCEHPAKGRWMLRLSELCCQGCIYQYLVWFLWRQLSCASETSLHIYGPWRSVDGWRDFLYSWWSVAWAARRTDRNLGLHQVGGRWMSKPQSARFRCWISERYHGQLLPMAWKITIPSRIYNHLLIACGISSCIQYHVVSRAVSNARWHFWKKRYFKVTIVPCRLSCSGMYLWDR